MTPLRLLLLLLLAAPAARADVPSPAPRCSSDVDCVLSDFQGCCPQCCPSEQRAWPRAQLEGQQRRCAAVDCAPPERCDIPCALPPQRRLVAVCRAGQCLAQAEPGRRDPDFCSADTDCVSSTFTSCCGSCCPAQPVAVTRARAQLQQQSCASRRCAALDCSRVACAQFVPTPIRPVCRANRCVAAAPDLMPPPPPPPPRECAADAECGVDLNPPPGSACWASPCGCCPSPRAVPLEQVRPPPVRRSPSTGQGAPFGLSQGGAQRAPSCGPCPAPSARLSAGCAAGRCVLR